MSSKTAIFCYKPPSKDQGHYARGFLSPRHLDSSDMNGTIRRHKATKLEQKQIHPKKENLKKFIYARTYTLNQVDNIANTKTNQQISDFEAEKKKLINRNSHLTETNREIKAQLESLKREIKSTSIKELKIQNAALYDQLEKLNYKLKMYSQRGENDVAYENQALNYLAANKIERLLLENQKLHKKIASINKENCKNRFKQYWFEHQMKNRAIRQIEIKVVEDQVPKKQLQAQIRENTKLNSYIKVYENRVRELQNKIQTLDRQTKQKINSLSNQNQILLDHLQSQTLKYQSLMKKLALNDPVEKNESKQLAAIEIFERHKSKKITLRQVRCPRLVMPMMLSQLCTFIKNKLIYYDIELANLKKLFITSRQQAYTIIQLIDIFDNEPFEIDSHEEKLLLSRYLIEDSDKETKEINFQQEEDAMIIWSRFENLFKNYRVYTPQENTDLEKQCKKFFESNEQRIKELFRYDGPTISMTPDEIVQKLQRLSTKQCPMVEYIKMKLLYPFNKTSLTFVEFKQIFN